MKLCTWWNFNIDKNHYLGIEQIIIMYVQGTYIFCVVVHDCSLEYHTWLCIKVTSLLEYLNFTPNLGLTSDGGIGT